ncbi:MAG: YhbY family RNA-binding protein [Holophagaceae bacterium]
MYRLTTKDRQYLKARAHQLKPTLIIGKDGLTPSFATELLLIIEKKELIKCKLSKVAWEQREVIETAICKISGGINLIHRIGHTLILFKGKAPDKTKYPLENSDP